MDGKQLGTRILEGLAARRLAGIEAGRDWLDRFEHGLLCGTELRVAVAAGLVAREGEGLDTMHHVTRKGSAFVVKERAVLEKLEKLVRGQGGV